MRTKIKEYILYKTIFFILLMISVNCLYAQELHQSLGGRIIDRDSKTRLIGVNLIIKNTDPIVGTISDEDGNFKFEKVPIGRHTIEAFYIGYEPMLVNSVPVNAGKEVVLTIEMAESVEEIEEIIVKSDKQKGEVINEMATVSARSFSVEETKRYAGSYNDPSRMAASYAGVTGDPSGNNDIVIRGNSPRGLLWRLEGIEIPNPNHFANEGASGGPISILNSNMLRNSDFFTGAFPAEYGNAYSGVFDINLRKGNNENREYSFMAGLLGLDCSIEGPFVKGKKASYLLNYRYSTLAMLNAIGLNIAGDAVPDFQDLAFNISLPTKKMGTFTLFGVGGLNRIIETDSTERYEYKGGMGVAGLTHTYFLDNSTFLKTTLAVTGSINNWSYFEENDEQIMRNEANENFTYKTAKASITYNRKLDVRNTLKTGFIYSKLNFDLFSDDYRDSLDRFVNLVDQKGSTDMIQGFASWKHRIADNITLLAGVHYIQLMLNDKYSVEPRFGFSWQVAPKHAINGGFGIHSKAETITSYFANTNVEGEVVTYDNKSLDFSKARHYVIGYQYNINQNLVFKTEFYYQDLYDVPVSRDVLDNISALNYSEGYADIRMINKGTGYNYGAEITLEKYFSKNYYFLITSSLYDSKYRGSDNILRNTRYNGNYVFNLLGGKEFKLKKNKTLGISVKGSWAGGLRYTPIDLERSIEEQGTVYDTENIFKFKRDDFIRFDLKIRYQINKKKTTRQWEIDIQNVTNTLNEAGDYFSTSSQEIVTYTQLGILPVLSYRIEF